MEIGYNFKIYSRNLSCTIRFLRKLNADFHAATLLRLASVFIERWLMYLIAN